MIRRPPRSTRVRSSAASDVYKRQPGGASVDWAGTLAVIVPPDWPAMSRSTRRWQLSNACVVTPLRTMLTHLIAPAWGDEIATVCPYVHSGATPAMTGRGPANRYGGL